MILNDNLVQIANYQNLIGGFATFSLVRDKICTDIYLNKIEVKKVLNINQLSYQALNEFGFVSYSGLSDLTDILTKSTKEIILDGSELNEIKSLLTLIKESTNYAKALSENEFKDIFTTLVFHSELYNDLNKYILPDGSINAEATSELRKLNKKIINGKLDLNKAARNFINSNNSIMMDDIISNRNNRICVLVKAGSNTNSGFIHGESSSGLALYYEPPILINLNNELIRLQEKWADLVFTIYKDLTLSIKSLADSLNQNYQTLIIIDSYFAKARFMAEFSAINAQLSDNRIINLIQAKHPEIDRDKVVANDYFLNSQKNILLISGPNTGGKSVSLKVVSLFVLATYLGLPILASEAEIGFFDNVFIDIGDHQSISESLSSFSAHLSTLKQILLNVNENSLVILDELGSGTDPNEGAAFAQAILEKLLKIGSFAIISTHYNQLKNYAYQQKSIQLASMEFDLDNNQPTYHILNDYSGSSYALEIAKKYDIPTDIIKRAQFFLNQQTQQSDKLIDQLNQQLLSVQKQKNQLQDQINNYQTLEKQLKLKINNLEHDKEKILNNFQNELDNKLKDITNQAQSYIAEYKKSNVDHHAIELTKKLEELNETEQEKPIIVDDTIVVGDYVKILSSSKIAQVSEIKKNNVILKVGGLSIVTTKNKVTKVANYIKPTAKVKSSNHSVSKNISMSCNLIGKRVEEAQSELANYLDSCLLTNIKTCTIIHGYGTGALRKMVWQYLSKMSFIDSYRLGEQAEGSSGATVVYFK
ncbi:MAG: endonuclease MutS2 [Erysipelotrichaceae bacterium]